MDLTTMIPMALDVVGALTKASGAQQGAAVATQQAQAAAQESTFEAQQLQSQSGEMIAAGQAAQYEQSRQTAMVNSSALAIAAAGGGGKDPTVMNLIARNSVEGSYKGAVALYNGEDKARALGMDAAAKNFQAQLDLQSGAAKASAYQTTATSALLAGASSLYTKYGMNGPKNADTTSVDPASADTSGAAPFQG